MGLRARARRMVQTSADLDRDRLHDHYGELDVMSIDECPMRVPVRIGGEVQGLRVVPRAGSPSLEITVADGTAKAVAVFLGRQRLPGLECGRGVILEGVARRDGARLVLLNPAYTLLPR
ncbi:MAG: hypothetical protein ACT4PW_09210 [Acidimicrobiia bacterium]